MLLPEVAAFLLGVLVGMGVVLVVWGHRELERLRDAVARDRAVDRPWREDWRTIFEGEPADRDREIV